MCRSARARAPGLYTYISRSAILLARIGKKERQAQLRDIMGSGKEESEGLSRDCSVQCRHGEIIAAVTDARHLTRIVGAEKTSSVSAVYVSSFESLSPVEFARGGFCENIEYPCFPEGRRSAVRAKEKSSRREAGYCVRYEDSVARGMMHRFLNGVYET